MELAYRRVYRFCSGCVLFLLGFLFYTYVPVEFIFGFGADIGVVRHVAGYMLWLGLSSPCRVWGTLNDTQNGERRVIKK